MKALIILFLTIAVFGGAALVGYKFFIQPQIALKKEKDLPPPPAPPDPTVPEFNKCVAVRKSGKVVEARDALYSFIEHYPESSKIDDAKNLLGDLNTDIILSTMAAPEKQIYIVQKGDVIGRVASRNKTTGELLMRANNLQGPMLRIGQKLSIAPADFSLVISRKHEKVTVLNKGRFFKQYPVLEWPPAYAKKTGPTIKVAAADKKAGKVTDKISWLNGTRVTFMEKGYLNSTHWIQINIKECTLHSVAEEHGQKPTGGGIRLTPDALDELDAILAKGDPVTLE
ncbi:MAG TPA: LysM peptidoglycan-binding domain-containing protein [Chthoniobacter sp.]|nr:LysM peptidoglycan-binding domain-containing protein [Chthoniobacter sp.]